ncbi:MAG: type II toxin-antitoxin system RelE/ParE family toxin [Candidatus Saccharibacteria bacterium]|nr:type II toxin-antitoxin system RelE/ParE family toxin [Candidatus Saccharibacteria bacterium]
MSYNIITTPAFDKQIKHLAKKYSSMRDDYAQLLDSLQENPNQGVSLKDGFRKIRMAISSKGKGKSGGARVITLNCFLDETNKTIILVTIYDKNEQEDISDKEIRIALSSLNA